MFSGKLDFPAASFLINAKGYNFTFSEDGERPTKLLFFNKTGRPRVPRALLCQVLLFHATWLRVGFPTGFILYGHGGCLGCRIILQNFVSLDIWMLQVKQPKH